MTQELTTTSILALFETDKSQRESFVADIVNRLENGDINPLKVHLQVKAMEEIIDRLTNTTEKGKQAEAAKKYRNLLLSEAEKQEAKKFSLYNASFEIKEVGTKYNYSQCSDPELAELEAQMTAINEKLKERQKFLQTVPSKGLPIVNEETGETYTVYPPSKSSTTSVTVSLK